jgi:hypothetical protein
MTRFKFVPEGAIGGIQYVTVLDEGGNPMVYNIPREEAEMDYPDDDAPGVGFTRAQVQAWAGRALTDEEIERIEEAVSNSSIPEAIGIIASALEES